MLLRRAQAGDETDEKCPSLNENNSVRTPIFTGRSWWTCSARWVYCKGTRGLKGQMACVLSCKAIGQLKSKLKRCWGLVQDYMFRILTPSSGPMVQGSDVSSGRWWRAPAVSVTFWCAGSCQLCLSIWLPLDLPLAPRNPRDQSQTSIHQA